MEIIIQQMMQEMLDEAQKMLREGGLNIGKLVSNITDMLYQAALKLIAQHIMEADRMILEDKEGRRREGWTVERRGDVRTITTQIGELSYERTYYYNTKTREYRYLIDQVVGVSPYMRVDTALSEELVRKSRHASYQRAAEEVCDGLVSKQTVMNKIRIARPVVDVPTEKHSVPELHIDADEDHVALQGKQRKGKAIVPLVSVYEGVEAYGKRRYCKNIFHISSYPQNAEKLWEDVLTRAEQRYDLSNTKIYLHGDGAAWIAKGKGWFPHVTFVLDPYHKNKYVKQMLAGYDISKASQLRKDLEQALSDMDEDYFNNIVKLLIRHSPEREPKIREAATYLHSHMAEIAIRATDPAACNGGATEPHVSHVLSDRLSSRPKGWSEKTLQSFAPILANGPKVRIEEKCGKPVEALAQNAIRKTGRRLRDCTVATSWQTSFPALQTGKRTELFKALKGVAHGFGQ